MSTSAVAPAAIARVGWAESAEKSIARLCVAIAAVALFGDFILVCVAVLSRHLLHRPVIWADEVASMLLVAMTFIGAAAGFSGGHHPGMRVVQQMLPPGVRSVIEAAEVWLVLVLAVLLAILGAEYAGIVGNQVTATGLPQTLFLYPMVAGSAVMAALAALRLTAANARTTATALGALVGVALFALAVTHLAPNLVPSPLAMLIAVFAICLTLGVPIAFALLSGSLVFLTVEGNIPYPVLAQQAVAGIENFVLLSIPFFILTGVVMELNGMSVKLINLIRRLVGQTRSGFGITTIISMVLFSGVSGSKAADVTAVGTIVVPAVRRAGQSPAEGTALLAASAVMAETIPPCINLIILGYVCNISIGALFVGGLLPALFMAAALVAVVVYASRRWPPPAPEEYSGNVASLLLHGLLSLGVIAIIFVGYKTGFATATEIGVFATLYAVAVGYIVQRDTDWRRLAEAFTRSAVMAGSILFVIAAAQTVAFSLTIDRVPQALAEAILTATASTGLGVFMVLSIVLLIVMGSALEGAPALIIFGPILLPIAIGLGVDPVQYGLVLIVAMGIGLFAPPLGIGIYISCAVGGVRVEDTVRPIAKYLLALFLCLLVLAFVPDISLALPRALGLIQ